MHVCVCTYTHAYTHKTDRRGEGIIIRDESKPTRVDIMRVLFGRFFFFRLGRVRLASGLFLCVDVCMYVYYYIYMGLYCMYVTIYVCVYICIYVTNKKEWAPESASKSHTLLCVCMHACIQVYMYHVHTYMHAYICTIQYFEELFKLSCLIVFMFGCVLCHTHMIVEVCVYTPFEGI